MIFAVNSGGCCWSLPCKNGKIRKFIGLGAHAETEGEAEAQASPGGSNNCPARRDEGFAHVVNAETETEALFQVAVKTSRNKEESSQAEPMNSCP